MADLLVEALIEADHVVQLATTSEVLLDEIDCNIFDVAIVDLDSRDRGGAAAVNHLRQSAPAMTVIALFPCGGLASEFAGAHYHLALEKPARIHALLAAVQASSVQLGRRGP